MAVRQDPVAISTPLFEPEGEDAAGDQPDTGSSNSQEKEGSLHSRAPEEGLDGLAECVVQGSERSQLGRVLAVFELTDGGSLEPGPIGELLLG